MPLKCYFIDTFKKKATTLILATLKRRILLYRLLEIPKRLSTITMGTGEPGSITVPELTPVFCLPKEPKELTASRIPRPPSLAIRGWANAGDRHVRNRRSGCNRWPCHPPWS